MRKYLILRQGTNTLLTVDFDSIKINANICQFYSHSPIAFLTNSL